MGFSRHRTELDLFILVSLVANSVCEVKIQTSETNIENGGSVQLTCITPDHSDNVFFLIDNINQGGCVIGLGCSSGITQPEATKTQLIINSFSCSTHVGKWKCSQGMNISDATVLSCLDSSHSEDTSKGVGAAHAGHFSLWYCLEELIKRLLKKIKIYLTRLYIIITVCFVTSKKDETVMFYKEDASGTRIPLKCLTEEGETKSCCVTLDKPGKYVCEITKDELNNQNKNINYVVRKIEFRTDGVYFDEDLNFSTTIEFLKEKNVICDGNTTALNASEKKKLFQNCKTKLIPSKNSENSSITGGENIDVTVNQGIRMDENFHMQLKARHMLNPHKFQRLVKFEDSNQMEIEISFGYADTLLKSIMAVFAAIGCAITICGGLIIAAIVWFLFHIHDIRYCSNTCMIATTVAIPNAICLIMIIVTMLIWKWREKHPLACDLPDITFSSYSYNVHYGKTSSLECNINSHPELQSVSWKKKINGVYQDLNNENKYKDGTVSKPSLIIENFKRRDVGEYRCFASNSCGTTESEDVSVSLNSIVRIQDIILKTTSSSKVQILKVEKDRWIQMKHRKASQDICEVELREEGKYKCIGTDLKTGKSGSELMEFDLRGKIFDLDITEQYLLIDEFTSFKQEPVLLCPNIYTPLNLKRNDHQLHNRDVESSMRKGISVEWTDNRTGLLVNVSEDFSPMQVTSKLILDSLEVELSMEVYLEEKKESFVNKYVGSTEHQSGTKITETKKNFNNRIFASGNFEESNVYIDVTEPNDVTT